MVRRARFTGVVAALLAATTLVGASPALADPHDDKSRVDRELAATQAQYEDVAQQARDAVAAYQAATAQLPAAQERLTDARVRVVVQAANARQAQRDAHAAQDAADAADAALDRAAAAVATGRQAVSDFVTAVYQGGGIIGFNALLAADDPRSLADAVIYLDRLTTARTEALEHYVNARALAVVAADQAQAARAAAAAAADAADLALAQAQTAQQQAQTNADAVQALVDRQQQALTNANAQRAAVLAHYNDLKAQAAQIEAELAALARSRGARITGNAPPLRPGAILLMPVRNAWKSSNYGMRYDPYYHVWQLHAGVDLAVAGGSPIYAARAGTVIWAAPRGGNGNYTCLDHGRYQGRELTTCYAHQSRFAVHTGQRVAQGQVIGYVGSTGASTGYHLHFEVRINGSPIQPLDWLPGCLC